MITEEAISSTEREKDRGRQIFAATMLGVIAIRLCIVATGFLSVHLAPPRAEPRFYFEHPWLAFDARAYREIALHGYPKDRIGTPYMEGSSFTLIAYFPAWPFISRLAASALPIDAAMIALSNLCSLVGFIFLYQWAKQIAGIPAAVACVLLAATFPGAVSFAAGATEGPFFMLIAIALWLLQREWFYAAALCVCVATATRPTGVALAMVVPLYAWSRQTRLPPPKRLLNVVLLGAISFSGAVGYEAFLWHRYKSPTAYLDAQANWNRLDAARVKNEAAAGVDRHSLHFYLQRLWTPQVWNRGIALLILAITLAGLLRPMGIPRLLFLFPLVIFLMTSLPGRGLRISSVPRYESAAAPLFLLVALWLRPRDPLAGASSAGDDARSEAPRRREESLSGIPARLSLPTPRSFFAPFGLHDIAISYLLMAILLLQLALQLYYACLFPRQIWVG